MKFIYAALALAMAQSGHAETNVLLNEVRIAPISRGGDVTGCSLQFTTMFTDGVYRQGQVSGIDGSLTWSFAPKGRLGLGLKLAGKDFSPNMTVAGDMKVAYAYLAVARRPIHAQARYQCENASNFCGVYGRDIAMSLLEAAMGQQDVSVGFNRHQDGMDVTLPIAAASEQQMAQFGVCMLQVFQKVQGCLDAEGRAARR
jgi:hypothetical protein